ncbi:MAG: NAD(P)H-dependent oxidoreductase [Defluviitaleaceae bacterium]|nr:NAD(P)H-dependent oxidoreductase [Defluviitaleaceae bacterium]
MKIAYIYGNMTHYDRGLSKIIKRTKDVFSELEIETETIDLGALHPPYFDGETTNALDSVMEKLRNADGIILATTAQMFAPTALMQSFIEYLEHTEYANVLTNKHCMLIALSQNGGEKSTLEYLTRVVHHMGGFVAAQIGLQARHVENFDSESGEFTDKIAEDFYRAVKQNRQYIIPTDIAPTIFSKALTVENTKPAPIEEKPQKSESIQTHLNNFTEVQEKEIEELSMLFSQKYSGGDDERQEIVSAIPANPFAPTANELEIKTVEKLTRDLPNSFQSGLSAGLQAVIQLNITGSEIFDGFIHIHSTECTYTNGTTPAPDIIIMADATIWHDVLTKKTTAQKAFMIGGIKVRGDFVLLTKFDTLFKFPES